MIITFCLIFILLIRVFFQSHLTLGQAFLSRDKYHKIFRCCLSITVLIIVVYSITELTLMSVTIVNYTNSDFYESFIKQLAGVNISIVTGFGLMIFSLYFKFSGNPYKSKKHKALMRRISIIFFVWSFCIIIRQILYLCEYTPLN